MSASGHWIIAETGIRLNEACAWRPCDFQLDLQVVMIQRSAWRAVHVGSTKVKRARIFSLSPDLAAHLRAFIAARGADTFLFQRKDRTAWQGDHVVRNQLKPLLKQPARHFVHSRKDDLGTMTDPEMAMQAVTQASQRSQYEVIDSKQLASRWVVPESWVREHVRSRSADRLPHTHFGKYVRFHWGSPELEEWVERRTIHTSNRKTQ